MKVRLPLGIDNFKDIRNSDCYYIDKTSFINELLDELFKVNLITRPRRFGKTLTMSMLAEFFDIRTDSRRLFEGLEISGQTKLCDEWMNQWPVLFLTLKDIKGLTFEDAYGMLQFVIASLCTEHSYLGRSEKVETADREIFNRLMFQKGTPSDVKSALIVLIRMMYDHYGKAVILLIDEYDVPLAKANDNGYYREMLNVISSLLGMSWKTNPYLKFAVVTGCLRIAKESIFTGANNFVSRSISGKHYEKYFGFTEEEVSSLLKYAGLPDKLPEFKKWYDGYLFGEQEVYCPWDVINHVSELTFDPDAAPANYWKDTSHNGIIRRFIDIAGSDINDKFETLLSGGIIREHIVEDLTYELDHSSEANLWSILYLTGYLTQASPDRLPQDMVPEPGAILLRIPNEEVKTIFADTVAKWFMDTVSVMDRKDLFRAWWGGDDKTLTELVTDILFDTISYFDYKEDYYHAFIAGLFTGAGYQVSSNSEQGTGRADIVVRDRKNRQAIIIEAKRSKSHQDLLRDCEKALGQIEREQYARRFLKGYRTVLCYGAAFFEKECMIRLISKFGNERMDGSL